LQSDLKRILAYSTISALGTLTLFLGLGGTLQFKQRWHSWSVTRCTKGPSSSSPARWTTRQAPATRIGSVDYFGPCRSRPWLPALPRCPWPGLPPLLGFLSKELSYEAALHARGAVWVAAAVVTANILLVAVAGVAGIRPFLGKAIPTPKPAHEAPPSLWLGPVVLAWAERCLGHLARPRERTRLSPQPALPSLARRSKFI
jgi:multicomponent Na+:H+ antiporter subunit A